MSVRDLGLTDAEQQALELTARLWNLLVLGIVTDGPSRTGDLQEMCGHVHALQRAVMSNAAARAHPELYRLLGGSPPPQPT